MKRFAWIVAGTALPLAVQAAEVTVALAAVDANGVGAPVGVVRIVETP